MTFTEAAEAVLRKAGKPLNYKKITQLAIEENLLSHVGKTPEVTMSTRLTTLTRKDTEESNIVRVKPGVFGLREWANDTATRAAQTDIAEGATAAEGSETNENSASTELGEPSTETASAPPLHHSATPTATADSDAASALLAAAETQEPLGVAVESTESAAVATDITADIATKATTLDLPAQTSETQATQRSETAIAVEPELQQSPEELERAARLAASAEMFPEEEDDEEPLLGGADRNDPNRRKRRRRRRGHGPNDRAGGEGDETATPTDGPDEIVFVAEGVEAREQTTERRDHRDRRDRNSDRGGERNGDRDRGGERNGDRDRGGDRDRDRDRGGDRDRDRDRGGDRDRDRDRGGDRDRDRDRGGERDREPVEIETGRDSADLVVAMLSRRDDRQPIGVRALVDEAVRAGKMSGDALTLAAALSAAIRIDGARREARGERARLRLAAGRVGLVDWTLPTELVRAEADALAALERLREVARRYVLRRLNELPQSSFTEALVLLLERLGVSSLRTTRRPGLPQGEVHLSGVARRGPEELPVAVVLKRGGEIGRERVIELRGSLHHYNHAQAVWMLSTGSVLSGARDEAAQPGSVPVTLLDGSGLGRMLDEHSVLVHHATVSLPWLDVDLFDTLRGG